MSNNSMLNRLKSLELQGYKTFADQTRFEFPGAITAIVGPNGSGKSNIADALRWVLGEQSYSLLRGKRTDDMIFYGSEQRARASMASATITFDNSDGWLPIDFSDVAVTRRAYRDGQNEYLLNGQKVRLKEITELLAKSGLAERTYTIIGQGLVDTALALKPDERRKLFEEAAGIGLYRSRKEEALHRLDTTRRNLERVQDILAELKPRLSSLERQARKAQEYEQVRADLRMLLRDWYGFHWYRNQEEVKRALSGMAQQEKRLVEARRVMGAVGGKITEQRAKMQTIRSELSSLYTQASTLNHHLEELNRQMAVLDERDGSLDLQIKGQVSALAQLEEELKAYQQAFESGDQEARRLASALEEACSEQEQARLVFDGKRVERETAELELRRLREELVGLETEKVRISARRDELTDRLEALQNSLAHLDDQIKTSNEMVEELQQKLEDANKSLDEVETREREQHSKLKLHQSQLTDAIQHQRDAEAALTDANNLMLRTQMQLDLLKQAEQSLSGYAEGARHLMQAAREGKLPGVKQTLASLLDVDPEYENAIAGALGEFIDLIILEDGKQTNRAISMIEAADDSRAALLPLDWASTTSNIKSKSSNKVLGMASDFAHCPPEYQPVVNALLAGIPVVKDGASARSLLAGQPSSVRVVTLNGELYCANGPVLVGKGGRGGIISRSHQIQDLAKQVEKMMTAQQGCIKDLDKAKSELEKLRAEEEQLTKARVNAEESLQSAQAEQQGIANEVSQQQERSDFLRGQQTQLTEQIQTVQIDIEQSIKHLSNLDKSIAGLTQQVSNANQLLVGLDLTELESQVAHWDKQVAVADLAHGEAVKRVAERQAACDRATAGFQSGQDHLNELQLGKNEVGKNRASEQAQRESLKAEIAGLQSRIDAMESDVNSFEKELEGLQQTDSSSQQNLTQAERYHTQAQLDLSRQREALDSLQRRIEDDFGLVAFEFADTVSGQTPLPFEGIVEQLSQVEELPLDIEDNINRQKGMMRRMGAVNLEAQEEYTAVRERYEFLTTQVEDLNKADADLIAVIAELDELMKKAFQTTFTKVAEEFHHTFARLFPGGHARLELTNEEDVIESGIEIEARLPGRREQGLSLLSGGERSLTASALVFALLKVSPTPFCVLDEVDAMLDEANVNRFSELLTELSMNTQFVVITHNRNTIQVAGVIYGITIGRDSASRVISLRMDEVTDEYVK
ncbi:MAG: chromosome segregation protein SMC [Anaerolineaceae bacterium]|nr:chromosome segregation protein SMC [Anaerolineaceae bacterium]